MIGKSRVKTFTKILFPIICSDSFAGRKKATSGKLTSIFSFLLFVVVHAHEQF